MSPAQFKVVETCAVIGLDKDLRYIQAMARYSAAEAQADLPRLLEAAERGEDVYVDHGHPDAAIKLVWTPIRPREAWDMEWLDAHRVRPRRGKVNTAAMLQEMKDESVR